MTEIENKDVRTLDFAALAKLAEAATLGVRAEAMQSSVLLSVWKDGGVAMVDPLTGATRPADDGLERLGSALEQQATLTVDA
jgi:hypothetical protein